MVLEPCHFCGSGEVKDCGKSNDLTGNYCMYLVCACCTWPVPWMAKYGNRLQCEVNNLGLVVYSFGHFHNFTRKRREKVLKKF